MKHIVYIITNGNVGGAQTHIFHLAAHLKTGYRISVVTGTRGLMWERLVSEGVDMIHCPSLVRNISPFRDIKCLREMVGILKAVKPDLVSTHSSKAGIIGRIAARFCRVPVVFTAHGWAFSEGIGNRKRFLYKIIEKVVAGWTKRIICVSEYDYLLAKTNKVGHVDRLITIHNGIPDNHKSAKPGLDTPVVKLIMVARFEEQKDQSLLIQALHDISPGNRVELVFVGGGPGLPEHREMVSALDLNNVQFLGDRDDIPELLAGSHIFILASKWEGLPRSILEAMRAGLPVIASDVGGIKEITVNGETGFLVPRGDLELLKESIIRLVHNPELREKMGSLARSRYLENFTFDRMLDKTLRVYKEILG